MSFFKNLIGSLIPIRESRRSGAQVAPAASPLPTVLTAVNAELVMDVNGDQSAVFEISGGAGAFTGTLVVEGGVNGSDYDPMLFYPSAAVSGIIPRFSEPMLSEVFSGVTSMRRKYHVACGGLTKIRIRASALTVGQVSVWAVTDAEASAHPNVRDQKTATLCASATAAASAAVTATLAAVPGLRHYICAIKIRRSATTSLVASATPSVITTTNIPGALAFTMGVDVSGVGIDKDDGVEFGTEGLGASAIGTATTVVAPALAGAIWRINVFYRLGL